MKNKFLQYFNLFILLMFVATGMLLAKNKKKLNKLTISLPKAFPKPKVKKDTKKSKKKEKRSFDLKVSKVSGIFFIGNNDARLDYTSRKNKRKIEACSKWIGIVRKKIKKLGDSELQSPRGKALEIKLSSFDKPCFDQQTLNFLDEHIISILVSSYADKKKKEIISKLKVAFKECNEKKLITFSQIAQELSIYVYKKALISFYVRKIEENENAIKKSFWKHIPRKMRKRIIKQLKEQSKKVPDYLHNPEAYESEGQEGSEAGDEDDLEVIVPVQRSEELKQRISPRRKSITKIIFQGKDENQFLEYTNKKEIEACLKWFGYVKKKRQNNDTVITVRLSEIKFFLEGYYYVVLDYIGHITKELIKHEGKTRKEVVNALEKSLDVWWKNKEEPIWLNQVIHPLGIDVYTEALTSFLCKKNQQDELEESYLERFLESIKEPVKEQRRKDNVKIRKFDKSQSEDDKEDSSFLSESEREGEGEDGLFMPQEIEEELDSDEPNVIIPEKTPEKQRASSRKKTVTKIIFQGKDEKQLLEYTSLENKKEFQACLKWFEFLKKRQNNSSTITVKLAEIPSFSELSYDEIENILDYIERILEELVEHVGETRPKKMNVVCKLERLLSQWDEEDLIWLSRIACSLEIDIYIEAFKNFFCKMIQDCRHKNKFKERYCGKLSDSMNESIVKQLRKDDIEVPDFLCKNKKPKEPSEDYYHAFDHATDGGLQEIIYSIDQDSEKLQDALRGIKDRALREIYNNENLQDFFDSCPENVFKMFLRFLCKILKTKDLDDLEMDISPVFKRLENVKLGLSGNVNLTSIKDELEIDTPTLYSIILAACFLYDYLYDQAITSLIVHNAELTRFPSLKLPHLKKLSLYNNKLKSTPVLEHLKQLKYLNLSHNNIWGNISFAKSKLSLEELKLDHNAITDISKIRDLKELRILNISHNLLEKLPKKINKVQYLQELKVSHNFISKTKPLDGLKHLRNVNLSYNKLEELERGLIQLRGKKLEAKKKHLDKKWGWRENYEGKLKFGKHADEMQVLKNIPFRIDVSHNKIKRILTTTGTYYRIEELDLSHNKLEDFPDVTMSCLEKLNLSNNLLEDVPNFRMKELKKINLSHNLLKDIPNFDKTKKLGLLNLLDNKFEIIEDILEAIKNINKFKANQKDFAWGFTVVEQIILDRQKKLLQKNEKRLKKMEENEECKTYKNLLRQRKLIKKQTRCLLKLKYLALVEDNKKRTDLQEEARQEALRLEKQLDIKGQLTK